MKRREVIRLVTLATGSVLSVPLMNSLLIGCKDIPIVNKEDYNLQFFDEKEFSFVKTLIDTILPKTDSPSATEVGVHQIIDDMIANVYSPTDSANYRRRFSALHLYLKEASDNQLVAIQNLSTSTNESDKEAKRALLALKQQTVAYYLSTEVVIKKHLNYLPVPGKYEPCISLESVGGKIWGL